MSFRTLLKQSKFASFDPRISQVYTTHGGDAYRGHWGLKRPLPLRRRGAFITVKNIDTPEHQTEWNSAEPQGLWIKNWDELKITPHKHWFGEDTAEENIVDSDYVPQSHNRPSYIPNLEAMTRDEFARYLNKIRACRDAFIQQRAAREHADGATSYQISNMKKGPVQWHDQVAAQLSHQRRSDPRNREIEHLPHSSGGLSYAKYSPLQTFLMTKERKGRLADEDRARDKNLMGYVASFAGMAGRVPKKQNGMTRPVVWDDPRHTGEVMIRPQKVGLERCPVVVGARQGLKAAKLNVELRVWDEQSHYRSNPHTPGTREYIAAEPPQTVDELTRQAAVGKAGWGSRRKPRSTLFLLKSAINK